MKEDIEEQVNEVSDPARQDEKTEKGAADGLDERAARDGRFTERIQEGGKERREAQEFLGEVADQDEARQEESRERLEEHEQAVDDAIDNIVEFDS